MNDRFRNSLERNMRRQELIRRISNQPTNRRLKNAAITLLLLGALMLMCTMIWLTDLSLTAIYWIRGCTGVLAIIAVIISAVYLYRVNTEAERQRESIRK